MVIEGDIINEKKPEEVEFHKALYEISLKKARKENPGINILE